MITMTIILSIKSITSVIAVYMKTMSMLSSVSVSHCPQHKPSSRPTYNTVTIPTTERVWVRWEKVNQRQGGNQVERTEDPSPWSSRLDREPMSSSLPRWQQSCKSCQSRICDLTYLLKTWPKPDLGAFQLDRSRCDNCDNMKVFFQSQFHSYLTCQTWQELFKSWCSIRNLKQDHKLLRATHPIQLKNLTK